MAQVSFGMVLRDARERKGYELSGVARRLRVRPDILQAIEDSDFSRMPPRGYARNMVNAYARYVGLNPTEITRMYLDECYAYQVGLARSDARQTGFDMSGAPGAKRATRHRHPADSDEGSREGALGRTLYVDDPHRDRRRDANWGTDSGYAEDRPHRTNREALPTTQYTNFYSGPKSSSLATSKLPFIIAGAVILILLIIVMVLVFGPKGSTTDENVAKLPVTGLADPTDSGKSSAGSETANTTPEPVAPAKVAPTKTVVTLTIPSGQTAYVDVEVDGTYVLNGDNTGPFEKSFDVTGVIKMNIVGEATVTQDGVNVPLESGDGGVSNITIDFANTLTKWQQDNPVTPPATSTTPAPVAANS